MAVSSILMAEDGPEVSRIAAGMMWLNNGISATELNDWIKACLDLGITTFDHADIYGGYTCEEIFGNALAKSSYLREKMQIVTKCGIKLISERRPSHRVHGYDTSKEHIIASVENSLKTLRTDYIDLLLIHRPDPLMNADEIAEAFTELYDSEKVLYFGVSNFTNSQFSLIDSRLEEFDLVTNQIEFSVMHMQPLTDGTLDWCQMLGLSPMAYSPFGGGDLFTGNSEQVVRLRQTLTDIGNQYDASMDQVALAWILKHPATIQPVLGTGKLDRIRSAANAENIDLSRDDWFRIWEASTGHEVP